MAFINDLIRGAGQVARGAAEEAPRAIRRADDLNMQARSLAIREKTNTLQAENQKRLRENDEQARQMKTTRLTLLAMQTSNKSQQKYLFDNLVKRGDMTQDAAKGYANLTDKAKAELARRVGDGEFSLDDANWYANSSIYDPKHSAFLNSLESSRSTRNLQKQQAGLAEAKTKAVKQSTKASESLQNVLRGAEGVARPSPQPTARGGEGTPLLSATPQPAASPSNVPDLAQLKDIYVSLLASGATEKAANVKNIIKRYEPSFGTKESVREDIVIKKDDKGNLVRIDRQTGERLSLDLSDPRQRKKVLAQEKGLPSQTGEELINGISRSRRQLLITPEQITTGTGISSNIRHVFSNFMGTINDLAGPLGVSGQFAPETIAAKAAIKSFNQGIKSDLTVNARNPVAELKTIEGFLIDETSNIQTPENNITTMVNLVRRLESDVIKFQNAINRGSMTSEQLIDFTNKVNTRLGVLSQMPTIVQLKIQSGRGIDVEDVETMSLDAIENFKEEDLTKEVAEAMLRRGIRLLNKK